MRWMICFFIFLLIPFGTLIAQERTYSRIYDLGGLEGCRSFTLDFEGNPIILTGRLDQNGRTINILELDKKGEIVRNLEYFDSTYAFYPGRANSTHLKGKVIFSAGTLSNYKTNNFLASIYKFDLVTEKFTYAKFSDTTRTEFLGFNETFDGGFIAIGRTERQNGNDDFLVVKYDSLLNESWVKTYGDGFNDEKGFYVEQLFDSSYLLSGYKEANNYLVHVNDTGKVLSWEVYHANYGGCLTVQSKDSNYLMRTTEQIYYPQIQGLGSAPTLRKINAEDNTVIWEKDMFSRYVAEFSSRPIEVENGNIYVAGFNYKGGVVHGMLGCFSAEGDSLWKRDYAIDATKSNYIYDMARTEDGYCVMTGSAHGWDQDVWVLKVDSNGCVVEGCGKPSVQEIDETMGSFFMYPNPTTTNIFTLTLPPQVTKGQLRIMNNLGQVILEKGLIQSNQEIQIPNAVQGIYFISVSYLLEGKQVVKNQKLVLANE